MEKIFRCIVFTLCLLAASVSITLAESDHICNHSGQKHDTAQNCSLFADANNDGICDSCGEAKCHHSEECDHKGGESDQQDGE